MKEIWKDINGSLGFYKISNLGRIKRMEQSIHYEGNFINKTTFLCERLLKPTATKKGYLSVTIYNNDRRRSMPIHRLVAIAFIPNTENKPQINHIDLNKKNNKASNLEWCTNRENSHHYNINRNPIFVGNVYFNKNRGVYISQIHINKITYTIGHSPDKKIAEAYYNDALEKWNTLGILPTIKRRSRLIQKNKNGDLIKIYDKLIDVVHDGYDMSSVSLSTSGKYKHNNGLYKNFIWRYE